VTSSTLSEIAEAVIFMGFRTKDKLRSIADYDLIRI
jgi:hypothetical protein